MLSNSGGHAEVFTLLSHGVRHLTKAIVVTRAVNSGWGGAARSGEALASRRKRRGQSDQTSACRVTSGDISDARQQRTAGAELGVRNEGRGTRVRNRAPEPAGRSDVMHHELPDVSLIRLTSHSGTTV